jgi:hypothetical protein
MPGATGQVVSVSGSTITLQDPRQSGTTTVELTGSTQIFKQATIAVANVPVGESVNAVGTQEGDTFTATLVRVGAPGAADVAGASGGNGPRGGGQAGGAPRQGGNGSGGGQSQANGAGQSSRNPGAAPAARVAGTVEQVTGDTIAVKASAGTTAQVRLAQNGRVTQQVAGTVADITPGVRIVVAGDRHDTTVTATRVEVMPASQQQ